MVNLTNPLQEVNMVTSPMLWSRPIPLGNDNDDDGDIDCDGEDDGYDENGEHGDLADAGVSIISKNGFFYKSSYLRFDFLLGMQN